MNLKFFRDTKHKILFIVLSCMVLLILGLVYIVIKIDRGEKRDNEFLKRNMEIAQELFKYKKLNSLYPNTLKEAGIEEQFCSFGYCSNFKYKVSGDQQDFKLAAKTGSFWIVYYDPICCWGLAVSRANVREDFPVYREDPQRFATPSAWPILEN